MGKGDKSAPILIGDRYMKPLLGEDTYPYQQDCVCQKIHLKKSLPPAELRKGIVKGCDFVYLSEQVCVQEIVHKCKNV